VEDNEDIVDVGSWEDADHGCSVLYASTDWIEHSDEHGLEKFEPSKNVEVIKVPGYEHNDDVSPYHNRRDTAINSRPSLRRYYSRYLR